MKWRRFSPRLPCSAKHQAELHRQTARLQKDSGKDKSDKKGGRDKGRDKSDKKDKKRSGGTPGKGHGGKRPKV